LGRARELAIRQSKGEWLAFLDQDDIWLPIKLEKQVALIQAEMGRLLGIVYGRTLAFSALARKRDFDRKHEFQLLPEGNIFVELFKSSCFIAISSAMLRRSAYDDIGGIPDEFQISCDYYLLVAIARRYRARAVQEVVCRYRVHGQSLYHTRRLGVYQEGLLLIDSWAHSLDADVLDSSRKFLSTVLAVAEIFELNGNGVVRLFRDGSIGLLLSRPFARVYRAIRRRVHRPYWRRVK